MEFDLSKPQKLLQKSARDLFARECPAKRVRELMATDTALHPELWSAVADQGWLGMHLPESCGGLGLGTVELAVVAEEMGRACFPGPFLGTDLGRHADRRSRIAKSQASRTAGHRRSRKAPWRCSSPTPAGTRPKCSSRPTPAGGGFKLSGRKSFVLDAGVADVIVCVARTPATAWRCWPCRPRPRA